MIPAEQFDTCNCTLRCCCRMGIGNDTAQGTGSDCKAVQASPVELGRLNVGSPTVQGTMRLSSCHCPQRKPVCWGQLLRFTSHLVMRRCCVKPSNILVSAINQPGKLVNVELHNSTRTCCHGEVITNNRCNQADHLCHILHSTGTAQAVLLEPF